MTKAVNGIVALQRPIVGRSAPLNAEEPDPHRVAEIVGDLLALGRGRDLDGLAVAIDDEMKRLVGARADDALHLAEALDGLAVDADHPVARQEAGPLGGAARIDDIDLGGGDALAEQGENGGEDDDGEEEIGDRTGGDDGRAGCLATLPWKLRAPLFGRQLLRATCWPALAAFSSSMNFT